LELNSIMGLSKTIVLFDPASRISTSERDPFAFTRSSTASSMYLTPCFTHVPFPPATNMPSLERVTNAVDARVSQFSSYRPAGTSAPFTMMGNGMEKGRVLSGRADKFDANRATKISVFQFIFIFAFITLPFSSRRPVPGLEFSAARLFCLIGKSVKGSNWFAAKLVFASRSSNPAQPPY
jgi:hypothetical protein